MTYKVCYWDKVAGEQRERDTTPEEAAEIDALKATAPAQQAEQTRLSEIDADIASSPQIAEWKAMTRAQWSTKWASLTTAQKVEVMERIAFVVIRRVL